MQLIKCKYKAKRYVEILKKNIVSVGLCLQK